MTTEIQVGKRIKTALVDADMHVGNGSDDAVFFVVVDGERYWVNIVKEPYGPLD